MMIVKLHLRLACMPSQNRRHIVIAGKVKWGEGEEKAVGLMFHTPRNKNFQIKV